MSLKKTILIAVLGLGCSVNSIAGCYVYEFAELQTYDNRDLDVMAMKFENVVADMLTVMGANMPPNLVNERVNCKIQAERMRHIIFTRQTGQVKGVP